MEILLLLLFLQVKHWYADFKIQTYMQTVKKGVWLDPIGISHSMEHMIASMIVLFVYSLFVKLNPVTVLWLCIVEGILHYVIDFIKDGGVLEILILGLYGVGVNHARQVNTVLLRQLVQIRQFLLRGGGTEDVISLH